MKTIFQSVVDDAITRYSKFNRPEPRDASRILGPALEAVCLSAKAPAERAAEWLNSQTPESITPESVREFVRSTTEVPTLDLEKARAMQAQLNKEIAAASLPPDVEERSLSITKRSRKALELRINNLRQQMACRSERIQLEDELDKRNAAIEGISWEPRFRLSEAGRQYVSVNPARHGY
jgi:hypothetical protein